jgi:hypothetical protein
MAECKLKKQGIILVVTVLLFAFIGCEDDLPLRIILTGMTVQSGGELIENDSEIYLSVDTGKTFIANVEGGGKLIYNWEVFGADGIVELTQEGGTATVAAKEQGDVKIKVTASSVGSTVASEFYINVNPPGVGDWTFRMFDESTDSDAVEISRGDTLLVPTGTGKTVTLAATVPGVIYEFENEDDYVVTLIKQTEDSFKLLLNQIVGEQSKITVKAKRGEEVFPKTFTAETIRGPVIFEWNSNSGLFTTGTFASGTVKQVPGSEKFYLAARVNIPIVNGAFRLGHDSATAPRLVIGSGSATGAGTPAGTATTTAALGPHIPGQLDLSEGTFRLTVDYADIENDPGNDVLLRVYINNNTESLGNSFLGSNSVFRVYGNTSDLLYGMGGDLAAGGATDTAERGNSVQKGRIVLTFRPGVRYAGQSAQNRETLKTAFIALYCHRPSTSLQFITITGLKLAEVDQ